MTSINIPDGVTWIDGDVFSGCSGLTSINIPNGVTSIGGATFAGCSGLTSITLPDGVTSIGSSAFNGCSGLTSITIPDGVTSIGSSAFNGCSGLTSITIPDGVTSIGSNAFNGCWGLTTITLPNQLSIIPELIFSGCSGLITVTLPNKLKQIRANAFKGCSRLTAVTIPSTVEYIYQNAFSGCTALEQINAQPTTPPFLYDNSFPDYKVTLNVPNGTATAYKAAQGWKYFSNISEEWYKLAYYIDGEEYKSYLLVFGAAITPEPAPEKEGYTFAGWSEIPDTMPDNDVTVTGTFVVNKYLISYVVDGDTLKTDSVSYGTSLVVEANPEKEGYTFGGWSEIPETMPAKDVTVTGTFIVNKYLISYIVDGYTLKTDSVSYGAPLSAEAIPEKEGYIFGGWSEIPETMPAKDVTVTGTFIVNKYLISYIVDGDTLKTDSVSYGASLIAEAIPEKEGYTFGGWSEIPETMPAKDVIVRGSFTVNTYKLVYIVDDQEYKTYDIDYGTAIIKDEEPTKEGHTFSGWSEIPETMPAKDIKVTGTFTANKYTLTYMVDGTEFKSMAVGYGTEITPEKLPTKEGYTFSGWNDMPKTMPAKDVTVTGAFTINKYTLSYQIDGIDYKTIEVEYGAAITSEAEPVKEGYTFSGWSEIPETMPAKDVTIKGSFTANKYTLTYQVNGVKYKTAEVEYGTAITSEAEPTKEGYTFSGWSEIPETMPAKEVTITGTFTINTYKLTYMIDNEVYKVVEYNYGAFITSEPQPEGDYVTFLWNDVPETMPAKDVTVYADYQTGIDDVLLARGIKYIYSPNGKRIEKLQKGLNIVVMNDGSVKKVVKK